MTDPRPEHIARCIVVLRKLDRAVVGLGGAPMTADDLLERMPMLRELDRAAPGLLGTVLGAVRGDLESERRLQVITSQRPVPVRTVQ